MTYSIHLLRHLRLTIGQNIHRQRLALARLAKATRISEALLDRFELGKNEIGLAELFKISCCLKMPPHDFLL